MTAEMRDVLVFEAGGRLFGLGIQDVERVLPAVRPVRLAHNSAFEGIVNLHGTAIPVFDLRVWFGDEAKEVQLEDLLIVVRAGTRRVGLFADRARGVAAIATSSIQPVQTMVPNTRHLAGVVMIADGIVFLPNVAAFMETLADVAAAEVTAA